MFSLTWDASSLTHVTLNNTQRSTTFVRWLNVMSSRCYFSLSQLLGIRVASSSGTCHSVIAGDIIFYLLTPKNPCYSTAVHFFFFFFWKKTLPSTLQKIRSGIAPQRFRKMTEMTVPKTAIRWFIALFAHLVTWFFFCGHFFVQLRVLRQLEAQMHRRVWHIFNLNAFIFNGALLRTGSNLSK